MTIKVPEHYVSDNGFLVFDNAEFIEDVKAGRRVCFLTRRLNGDDILVIKCPSGKEIFCTVELSQERRDRGRRFNYNFSQPTIKKSIQCTGCDFHYWLVRGVPVQQDPKGDPEYDALI